MSAHPAGAARGELAFLAGQTARLSHQINNVLAIVNELAGLLDDLALAAAAHPVPAERLHALAQRLLENVDRGAGLVRLLNRLAHTPDDPAAAVELGDLARLFAALSARPLELCRGTLALELPARPVTLRADPLALLRVLDGAREILCAAAPGPPALVLELDPPPAAPSLRLRLAEASAGELAIEVEPLRALAAAAGLEVALDQRPAGGRSGMTLTWPRSRPGPGGSA